MEALGAIETAEALDAMFAPLPANFYGSKQTKKKPKKKKKQLKIQAAFKNATKPEVNFQGVPLDKCTIVEELQGKAVFIHPAYEKAWTKKQKEPSFAPQHSDHLCCPHCNLRPCSVRLLETKLECDACDLLDLMKMEETEHREKLRFYYRAELMKLQGKRFMTKQMPNNNTLPACAKQITSKIASVEAGGCDSLLDNPETKKGCSPLDVDEETVEDEEEEWEDPSEWENLPLSALKNP